MKAEEKILKVLEKIKNKADISPINSILSYRAGWEVDNLNAEEEISILNKLSEEGIIEVVGNYSSDYS